eukprot:g68889.t1
MQDNWRERCEEVGFAYHSAPGVRWGWGVTLQDPYWVEDAAYVLTEEGETALRQASWELNHMCLEAVERVVASDELMTKFEVPPTLWKAVRESWQRRQPDLIGRFDLLYDGLAPPKLLEYNADTPTLLLESSIVQRDWLSDRRAHNLKPFSNTNQDNQYNTTVSFGPDVDSVQNGNAAGQTGNTPFRQFNQLPELLRTAWSRVHGDRKTLVVACQRASMEERCTAEYMARCAKEAGLQAEAVDIEELQPDPERPTRVLLRGEPVEAIWKLYPYEWLADEELGHALEDYPKDSTLWLEPPWKLILANKAILAVLWEMFPNHPNLLPAFFNMQDATAFEGSQKMGWVGKPKYGREGFGVRYSFESKSNHEFQADVEADLAALSEATVKYDFTQLFSLEAEAIRKQLNQLEVDLRGIEDETSKLQWAQARQQLADTLGTLTYRQKEVPFPPMGGPVFQQYYDVPTHMKRSVVVGAWVVHGSPAGVCFREDNKQTTSNDSSFVPHFVSPSPSPVSIAGMTDESYNGIYHPQGKRHQGVLYKRQTDRFGQAANNEAYLLRSSDGLRWMLSPDEF